MAMDVVERVVGRKVSVDTHQDLIAEAVSALRADATAAPAARLDEELHH